MPDQRQVWASEVTRALDRLGAWRADLIVASYFRGMTQDEIASRTGYPRSRVAYEVAAALREFAGLLNPPAV